VSTGDYDIPVPDVVAALDGLGAPENEFIVLDLRLPGC